MSHSTVKELVHSGVIQIGTKARGNPDSLDFPKLAVGIANKDYPAKTPFLWGSVYEKVGLAVRNVRTFGEPENAEVIFAAFRNDPQYIGGDVGVGFKDRVLQLLDDIDPLAKVMGAINVVVKTSKSLKGYNTDGVGFAVSLADAFGGGQDALQGRHVILLGAGGTTNAIAFALVQRGCDVTILNRTVSKAEDLADRINAYFGRKAADFGGRDAIGNVISNASAVVSVIDDPHSPLDQFSALGEIQLPPTKESIEANLAQAAEILGRLPKDAVVADVMLRNTDTATIAQAKAMGFKTLDGLPMVYNQAVEAFWLVNEEDLNSKGVGKQQVADIMAAAMKE
ncbi:MAG TPA: hypothetical protein VD998_03280 [Verrucomicrobiae bacterium]|nr:hypothetical protein [Verrucomicrobiae bacterium]